MKCRQTTAQLLLQSEKGSTGVGGESQFSHLEENENRILPETKPKTQPSKTRPLGFRPGTTPKRIPTMESVTVQAPKFLKFTPKLLKFPSFFFFLLKRK